MRFWSSRRIKRTFASSRSPESATDFLAQSGVAPELSEVALTIRSAIANLAGVEPTLIHANDNFDEDLAHYDFWGSLDTVAVVLELEECLRIKLTENQTHRIPHPEFVPGMTVAEFVRCVAQIVSEK